MSDHPLYPALPEAAAEEAQALIDAFKVEMTKAAEEVLGKLYCDVAVYIESDSWTNYRNELLDGLKNYDNRKVQAQYDFKQIRQAILANHREDIINDLNQDLRDENDKLKETIEFWNRAR